ncbi:MAG: DNA primase [Thermoproteota archaeon]|nr:MAG: DNA primase [Candidatus Korarchaeota archaeon]RLG54635.1 MAG: DNA primase [Candidatus Korarchaeota archaeon]
MAKESYKYILHFELNVKGLVEDSDVIGAIFGQLEGLLGEPFELRELQRIGKIGRIKAELRQRNGATEGHIIVTSNMSRPETALLAAAFESVDQVGPYPARIRLQRIVDAREERRKQIVRRAIEILRNWTASLTADTADILEKIQEEGHLAELSYYGPERLPCGPAIESSDDIIVVEGRADVIQMLKYGWRNVIAIGGATTTIPKSLIELSKRKNVTVFVDGDRGGELVLKNVLSQMDVDYVAIAPPGRSVEELSAKEIRQALRNAVPADEYRQTAHLRASQVQAVSSDISRKLSELFPQVEGKLEALLLDKNFNVVRRCKVDALYKELTSIEEGVEYIVYDGFITQRIVDAAASKGIKVVAGVKAVDVVKVPTWMRIVTKSALSQG